MNTNKLGRLYVVATPIGNLQDISLRALETLKNVDCIAAEDTRHSLPLLRHFSISTPLFALHEHNERDRVAILISKLHNGNSIALISDAGTPLICDPGYYLVKEVRALGIPVVPIPGACAAISALSVAGFPTDKFIFEGFLPSKTKGRVDRLSVLTKEKRTCILYEAPHRILDLLNDMREVFGTDRLIAIARELTKTFETIKVGCVSDIEQWVKADKNQQRGEFVVLIHGVEEQTDYPINHVLSVLLEELPVKTAVDLAVKITGLKKNILYETALNLKK